MSENILDQMEIDALLHAGADEPEPPVLTQEEEDALGEVGNIAMGASATTLSTLLGRKVSITSPTVRVWPLRELVSTFTVPYLVVNVRYTEGIKASTLLVIQVRDAAVIADLMMGNTGSNPAEELDELGISAAAEAMNQMIGAAATSLAGVVGRTISISPPTAKVMEEDGDAEHIFAQFEGVMVMVSFRMWIGDLVDTEIMQIMTVETAREEAGLLLNTLDAAVSDAAVPETPAQPPTTGKAAAPAAPKEAVPETREDSAALKAVPPAEAPDVTDVDRAKLDLILDIPLKVTVILGRTRRPIEQVLGLAPGAIVELAALADEPVEVQVNGVTVAQGEVVVVNENFGVRITSIMSPRERMDQLYGGGLQQTTPL